MHRPICLVDLASTPHLAFTHNHLSRQVGVTLFLFSAPTHCDEVVMRKSTVSLSSHAMEDQESSTMVVGDSTLRFGDAREGQNNHTYQGTRGAG